MELLNNIRVDFFHVAVNIVFQIWRLQDSFSQFGHEINQKLLQATIFYVIVVEVLLENLKLSHFVYKVVDVANLDLVFLLVIPWHLVRIDWFFFFARLTQKRTIHHSFPLCCSTYINKAVILPVALCFYQLTYV